MPSGALDFQIRTRYCRRYSTKSVEIALDGPAAYPRTDRSTLARMYDAPLRNYADVRPYGPKLRVVPLPREPFNLMYRAVVPGQAVWKLLSVVASHTASATVGTRQPLLQLSDGSQPLIANTPVTNPYVRIAHLVVPTASTTVSLTWAAGGFASAGSVAGIIGTQSMPEFVMPPGTTIEVFCNNGALNDVWNAGASLYVEELFTESEDVWREHDTQEALRDEIALLHERFTG